MTAYARALGQPMGETLWCLRSLFGRDNAMQMLFKSILAVPCIFLVGCGGYSGAIGTPPAAAVCTPYSFTFTVPAGVPSPPPPTVTGVTGLPTSLTVAGLGVTGTPAWNEFGTWPVSASGTVPAAPWY